MTFAVCYLLNPVAWVRDVQGQTYAGSGRAD